MLYEFVITIRTTVRNENPLNAMEAYRGGVWFDIWFSVDCQGLHDRDEKSGYWYASFGSVKTAPCTRWPKNNQGKELGSHAQFQANYSTFIPSDQQSIGNRKMTPSTGAQNLLTVKNFEIASVRWKNNQLSPIIKGKNWVAHPDQISWTERGFLPFY